MALHSSTIVLAVVTCVPFGLAIRDTLNGEQPRRTAPAMPVEPVDEERLQREREQEEREQRARNVARDRRALASLFGSEPASLGPGFAGISLGAPFGAEDLNKGPTIRYRAGHFIELTGHKWMRQFTITPTSGRAPCTELEAAAEASWGAPTRGVHGRYWVNPALHQRAWLTKRCTLKIEKYALPEVIDRTTTSAIPFWALGRPVEELQAQLAKRTSVELFAEEDPAKLAWTDHGLGPYGIERTVLRAQLVKGRITEIHVSAEIEAGDYGPVGKQLEILFGAAVADQELLRYGSRGGPQIETKYWNNQIYITATTSPGTK